MKVYCISTFSSSDTIDSFHADMFHGYVHQPTKTTYFYAHDPSNDESMDVPLEIVRNGWRVPEVFASSSTLVISQTVRDELEDFSNVSFLPVKFKKLVDFPYRAGDASFWGTEFQRRVNDPISLLNRLPDKPELHINLKKYYELVVFRLRNIVRQFDDLSEFKCAPKRSSLGSPEGLRISRELLSKYPMFWHIYYFFREDAFDKVQPFLDMDYFEVTVIEI